MVDALKSEKTKYPFLSLSKLGEEPLVLVHIFLLRLLSGLPENQGYNAFQELKEAIGSAGNGKYWHHIVEQSQIGKSGFISQQINNTSNIIAIDSAVHAKISGYYNKNKKMRIKSNGIKLSKTTSRANQI